MVEDCFRGLGRALQQTTLIHTTVCLFLLPSVILSSLYWFRTWLSFLSLFKFFSYRMVERTRCRKRTAVSVVFPDGALHLKKGKKKKKKRIVYEVRVVFIPWFCMILLKLPCCGFFSIRPSKCSRKHLEATFCSRLLCRVRWRGRGRERETAL